MNQNKVLIIDMTNDKISLLKEEFVKPIETLLISKFTTIHFSKLNEINLKEFNKVILSGTALKDFEYLNYINKFEFLKNIKIPVLGICAGMQVISKIFGCELENYSEIGMYKIKKIKENKLFSEKEFEAFCLHNKKTIINNNFEVLAESENCIQIIKLKQKEIYGCLFHPEVRNHKIIEKFISL